MKKYETHRIPVMLFDGPLDGVEFPGGVSGNFLEPRNMRINGAPPSVRDDCEYRYSHTVTRADGHRWRVFNFRRKP